MKIRNILFATFSHTYQATSLHSRRSNVDIFRSVVPTFQYPRHRSLLPVLSANSLRWSAAHCAKMLSSYNCFIRGKRWKSQGAKSGQMMVGDHTSRCSCSMRPSIVMKKGNIPHHLFWIKESNYSKHSTYGRRLYCFRHVYMLTTGSDLTRAMCRDWLACHICAKLHLILTVVLILQLIRPWKKKYESKKSHCLEWNNFYRSLINMQISL